MFEARKSEPDQFRHRRLERSVIWGGCHRLSSSHLESQALAFFQGLTLESLGLRSVGSKVRHYLMYFYLIKNVT